jgi:DNA (cytosine-5)-methyltransferase 1
MATKYRFEQQAASDVTAYYNEFDPFAAAWLRELMADGLIAEGEVDERSILDVSADDLRGYTQCHFFAGIGGWPYALRLAGWPDDRPVWTGSCPCQPFSSAGKQKGHDDERHLWPAFYELIAECRPSAVFGEQVASKLGREWLAGVRADLEDARYAVGGADLCAAGVGAPHIRQRLFWVAQSPDARPPRAGGKPQPKSALIQPGNGSGKEGTASRVAHAERRGRQQQQSERPSSLFAEAHPRGLLQLSDDCPSTGDGLGDPNGDRREVEESLQQGRSSVAGSGEDGWWASVLIPCADGKWRRVPADETGQPQPSIFPLAHGVPNRVGTLRGSGNAIVPQVAAEFIRGYLPMWRPS